jgi:CRISPR type III-B/RAMP module RAMP protein Cmr1
MDKLEFKVEFITPLLIHGADSQEADAVGLTGKALRGCWRFWFRAMTGGIVPDITPTELASYEGMVFGSTDQSVGAKFRLVVEPVGNLSSPKMIDMGLSPRAGSSRRVSSWGYAEGCQFRVGVLPRNSMSDREKDALLGSIWLWSFLGGAGLRARRGFGSPVMVDKHKPFRSAKALEQQLAAVVTDVRGRFERLLTPKDSRAISTAVSDNGTYFVLRGLDQTAVCEAGKGADVGAALSSVHGIRSCAQHGTRPCPELGYAGGDGRLASPVFLRFHKVGTDLFPVITWSHPNENPRSCARQWLRGLGFNKYLSGRVI